MKKSILSFPLALALIFSSQLPVVAAPAQYTIDFEHATGSTGFLAKGHPSSLRINGHGKCPSGQLNWKNGKINGTLTVDLTTLETGISTRDKHMKEKYLEVGKFPQATLKLVDLGVPSDDMNQDFSMDKVPFSGKLSLHGIENPVAGVAQVKRKGQTLSIHAEFDLKISDYKIDLPSFAGITVADEVSLSIQAESPLQAL